MQAKTVSNLGIGSKGNSRRRNKKPTTLERRMEERERSVTWRKSGIRVEGRKVQRAERRRLWYGDVSRRAQKAATAVPAKVQCVLSIVLRSVKCGGCGGGSCSRANTKSDPWIRHTGFLEIL